MRSLVLAVGVLAVISLALFMMSGEDSSSVEPSPGSRSLLALGPIRPRRSKSKGLHRHGSVQYRYQQVNCDSNTTSGTTTLTTSTTSTSTTVPTTVPTSSSTTSTTGTVPTTTTTVPTTTTTTRTTTIVTVTTTTLAPTTPPDCPLTCTCPPSPDLCYNNVPICPDRVCLGCELRPKNCNDNNNCTTDSCNNVTGQCVFTYNVSLPGCACTPTFCQNTPCQNYTCEYAATGPICVPLNLTVCDDNNNCTVDTCSFNSTNPEQPNCTFTFNSTLPGCAVVGGLGGGAIAGIVLGAVGAAALAAAIALWARRTPTSSPGASTLAQAPAANTSPLYAEPVNAGVMPV